MSKSKGAFEQELELYIKDALDATMAKLSGKEHKSKIAPHSVTEYKFKVLEDFTYDHTDQDVLHGKYEFKKDQIIYLRKREDPYFMPDRSKLEYLGEEVQSFNFDVLEDLK